MQTNIGEVFYAAGSERTRQVLTEALVPQYIAM
jgi:hypothetical protein